jgi:hypothetical protein
LGGNENPSTSVASEEAIGVKYQVVVKYLLTDVVQRKQKDCFRSYAKAVQHAREINEHCPRHEAWVEKIETHNPVRIALTWALSLASFWGIIGALVCGEFGAWTGAAFGWTAGIIAYCLFATSARADKRMETRDEERRKAA